MSVWRLIFANTSRWYCTYNSLLNNSIRRSPRRITTINPTVLVWYTRKLFYRNKTELAVINAILEIQYKCIRNEFWLKHFFNYGKDYTNWRHGSCVHFDGTYFSIFAVIKSVSKTENLNASSLRLLDKGFGSVTRLSSIRGQTHDWRHHNRVFFPPAF